jgi:hypothetical protein
MLAKATDSFQQVEYVRSPMLMSYTMFEELMPGIEIVWAEIQSELCECVEDTLGRRFIA